MRRKLFFLALVIALALVSITLARAGSAGAGLGAAAAPPGTAILSGGRYRLASQGAQAGVIASGGEYRLLPALSGAEGGPAAPTSSENGCCCTYLPCVLRNY